MKYTKQQRKDLYKAFKAAQPYLEEQGFVCWALGDAYKVGKITTEQQKLAKRLINDRIHPHYTVGTWLNRSAGIPDRLFTPKAMEAYRKRWLESLIKEFSE